MTEYSNESGSAMGGGGDASKAEFKEKAVDFGDFFLLGEKKTGEGVSLKKIVVQGQLFLSSLLQRQRDEKGIEIHTVEGGGGSGRLCISFFTFLWGRR